MKCVIAYVPVLHEGYVKLFSKHKHATLFIISPDMFATELPRIGRDLRCVDPVVMKKAVEALNIFSRVEVLTKETLKRVGVEYEVVVLPRDEMSDVLSRHLGDTHVVTEDVFLRWDKPITLAEQMPTPDYTVSHDAFDRECMECARAHAQKSADWWRQVGALAVRDGKVLYASYNKHHPSEQSVFAFGNPRDNFDAGEHLEVSDTLHGEAGIVARAAHDGVSLRGASIYVTTFPCIHCARLLAEAGIKNVYYKHGYSRLDAERVLKEHKVKIIRVV